MDGMGGGEFTPTKETLLVKNIYCEQRDTIKNL